MKEDEPVKAKVRACTVRSAKQKAEERRVFNSSSFLIYKCKRTYYSLCSSQLPAPVSSPSPEIPSPEANSAKDNIIIATDEKEEGILQVLVDGEGSEGGGSSVKSEKSYLEMAR